MQQLKLRLDWVSARPEHAVVLKDWTSADPPRMLYDSHRGNHHPELYALKVQSHVRSIHLPVPGHEAVLIGFDEHGPAAVCHFGLVDREIKQTQFMIFALAQAHRCRGSGYGREALSLSLDVMRHNRVELGLDCGVFGRVDPGNNRCKTMLRECGWEYLTMDRRHEVWFRDVPL